MEKQVFYETHFHPESDGDINAYIEESSDAGVSDFIAVGANLETSRYVAKIAEGYRNVSFSAGIHPHDAEQFCGLGDFKSLISNKKCVGVGEIGLDFFYENSKKECQIDVFDKFLALALEYGLPAIVHCRDKDGELSAYEESFRLLSAFAGSGGRFVVHCYTGTPEYAEKFLSIGGYLGITGIVTFPKAQNVRDVLKIIPDDKLLLETDAPYLAPVPKRGKRNHSKYLVHIAEKIANERTSTIEEIARITSRNARCLFARN